MNATARILIPIVSGSRVRNFLRTDLFKELRSNADVIVVSPAYNYSQFLREFAHPRVVHEAYYPKAPRRRIEAFLQTLETWFPNPGYASTDTYRIIVDSLSHNSIQGKYRKVQLRFSRTKLGRGYAQIMRELLRKSDFLLNPPEAYCRPFDRRNPSLVFTDYPFHYSYRPILKIARKRRIPIVCFVSSWDNLTSKGEIPVRLDKLIVWNEIMRKEAMELYGYDSKDIFVSGAPQFDVYFRKDALLPRDEFLRSVGLDPEKKVITYCTQGKIKYQNLELEAIKVILRRARERGFGDECQLIIRLHPGASPDRFLELEGEDVYVDSPGHSEIWLDGWDPGGADMRHLGNIIQSSDVVINIASTITIDASCLDRPVINIAFDADHPRPYWDSVARGYEYTHYRNIVRTSGVRLAKSKNELLEYVSAYLKEPRLDSEGRKRIVSEQCCYTDGKSGKRVADYVLTFLRSVASQDHRVVSR